MLEHEHPAHRGEEGMPSFMFKFYVILLIEDNLYSVLDSVKFVNTLVSKHDKRHEARSQLPPLYFFIQYCYVVLINTQFLLPNIFTSLPH